MYNCPKCNGPLQIFIYEDSDDLETRREFRCKRVNGFKKKKGCGYIKHAKAHETPPPIAATETRIQGE